MRLAAPAAAGLRLRRATRRKIIFAATALMLAVVPTALAIALTYWQAVSQARTRLGHVAEVTAERVRTVLWAAEGALVSVDYAARREGCSERLVAAFAAAATAYDWIRALAFVTEDSRLGCSSYGAFEPPIPLHGERVSLLGPEAWPVRFSGR